MKSYLNALRYMWGLVPLPFADESLPFVERVAYEVLEVLSPTRCAGCERAGALICQDCLAELTLIDPRHSCMRCGAPFGDLLCTECSVEGTSSAMAESLDRCLACAVYKHPLPRIIRAYKDMGERRLASYLAEFLFDAALHAQTVVPRRFDGLLSNADAVVFVPATAAAFRRRGFDHMEAIACSFCELSGLPLLDALVKYGHGDQRELGRDERREHARGMYETVEDVRGRRLLLIDDVITTGATMAAASAELKRAGAAAVDGLAIARVW